jgi:hypothetical protein
MCPPALGGQAPCEQRAIRHGAAIPVEDLGQWEPLDERTLLVWAPNSEHARLLRLSRRIEALPGTDMISIIDGDHDDLISPCGHDVVMVNGDGAEIISIRSLSEKETAQLDRNGWTDL